MASKMKKTRPIGTRPYMTKTEARKPMGSSHAGVIMFHAAQQMQSDLRRAKLALGMADKLLGHLIPHMSHTRLLSQYAAQFERVTGKPSATTRED